jgi:ABC-2 type transport system permease protein
MRRFVVLFRLLLLMNLRDKSTLFWSFAFPIGLIILYGIIWGTQTYGPFHTVAWLMVGVVVLNIMSSGFIGDAAWLTTLRERGFLVRVRATPLSNVELIAAYVLVRVALGLLQSALIIAVGMLLFAAPLTWEGLGGAMLLTILGIIVFIALGQAIAAVAPTPSASVALGQVIYFPLMFLSNLFVPITLLPTWLADLARWNPAYMLVDLLRPTLVPIAATQATWVNLLGLALYGLLGIVLAARFFRWTPQN